jgi:hypothetical protein
MARTSSTPSDTEVNLVAVRVRVRGIRPIIFDRYAGDNNTKLAWHEKIYLKPGTDILSLPALNIDSFYTGQNTPSATKRLRDKRKYKDICNSIQSFCTITAMDGGEYIPFLRNDEPITVGEFDESSDPPHDPQSGLYLRRDVARLKDGVPNPKERPVLPLPWSLEYRIQIIPNKAIKEAEIRSITKEGGLAIGFGTYRGRFGKFLVDVWEHVDPIALSEL